MSIMMTTCFLSKTLPSIQMHVTMYLPAILLGIVGGLLGALFTRVNVFINQKRKVILSKMKNVRLQQLIKMLEPCFIVVGFSASFDLILEADVLEIFLVHHFHLYFTLPLLLFYRNYRLFYKHFLNNE